MSDPAQVCPCCEKQRIGFCSSCEAGGCTHGSMALVDELGGVNWDAIEHELECDERKYGMSCSCAKGSAKRLFEIAGHQIATMLGITRRMQAARAETLINEQLSAWCYRVADHLEDMGPTLCTASSSNIAREIARVVHSVLTMEAAMIRNMAPLTREQLREALDDRDATG